MVPTRIGKMGEHFPVTESPGILPKTVEKSEKVYWKIGEKKEILNKLTVNGGKHLIATPSKYLSFVSHGHNSSLSFMGVICQWWVSFVVIIHQGHLSVTGIIHWGHMSVMGIICHYHSLGSFVSDGYHLLGSFVSDGYHLLGSFISDGYHSSGSLVGIICWGRTSVKIGHFEHVPVPWNFTI